MSKTPAPKKAAPKPHTPKSKAPAPKKARESLVLPENVPLTARQEAFVREYLIDLNGTQAAIRAGYSTRSAAETAAETLRKPNVQVALQRAQRERAQRTEITADRVLREIWAVATADPRELVQVKVGCCRCCWGEGHRHQRTVAEMNYDREAFAAKGGQMAEFDEQGGIGFDSLKPPHPLCPNCGGDGDARTVLADTRNLSPSAAALFAGAKTGKYGIEISMHSKMNALEMVAKHIGLYKEDNTQKADALSSLLMSIAGSNGSGFKPVAVDPEQAEARPGLLKLADDDED